MTPTGTVSGANVVIMISLPSPGEADNVMMVGTATVTNFAGTYTDSLADTGTRRA
jgi:hypothetical protein